MSIVRFLHTHREMLTLTTRATYQIEKLAKHYKTNKLNIVPLKKNNYKVNPLYHNPGNFLDSIERNKFTLYIHEPVTFNLWDSTIDWIETESREKGSGFVEI